MPSRFAGFFIHTSTQNTFTLPEYAPITGLLWFLLLIREFPNQRPFFIKGLYRSLNGFRIVGWGA